MQVAELVTGSLSSSQVVGVTWFPVIHFQNAVITQFVVACGGLVIVSRPSSRARFTGPAESSPTL